MARPLARMMALAMIVCVLGAPAQALSAAPAPPTTPSTPEPEPAPGSGPALSTQQMLASDDPGIKLDLEAIRKQVRAMKIDDELPTASGSVLSAAPSREQEKFKRKFNEGKRPWCLTAFQGFGVLALLAMPLSALLDKKDHGCKW